MPDKVRILFLGDIVGRSGRKALKRFLPEIEKQYSIDFIIANGENAAGGIGLTEKVGKELLEEIDILTSGNHIWDKKEALAFLDKNSRILRPANFPPGNPGKGGVITPDRKGRKIAVLNLQGRIFMEPIDCPFQVAVKEIEKLKRMTSIIIVDFHAEATSEKQALGWYLDGKVSALIGTHTHVLTADERILPGGTAYITDVGMIGGINSVIGIKKEQAIKRFLTAIPQRFEVGKGRKILSGTYLEIDSSSGKAISIKRIMKMEDEIE
ncbi:MAG: TIGR00282 family metallophosphoesterase [Candidatus Aminicenantia bacterium]